MRPSTSLLPLLLATLPFTLTLANPAPAPTPAPAPVPAPQDAAPTLGSSASSALISYYSSLMADPLYTSAASAVVTAIPESEIEQVIASPTEYFMSLATATAPPPWFTALPTSYQQYFSSIGGAEASILASATAQEGSAARQTGAPMLKGLVVGGVAVAGGLVGLL